MCLDSSAPGQPAAPTPPRLASACDMCVRVILIRVCVAGCLVCVGVRQGYVVFARESCGGALLVTVSVCHSGNWRGSVD